MTSGVYQLTFTSGARYIGKSVNIEERWNQHLDKFRKGTASKPMQAEYNAYGGPTGSILFACHEDHIDLVEACFITRNRPELNTTRPPDPFPWLKDSDSLNSVFGMLGMSTAEHVSRINELSEKYLEAKRTAVDLEEIVEDLERIRSKEEVATAAGKRAKALEQALATKTLEHDVLAAKLRKELNRSWWDKVFN